MDGKATSTSDGLGALVSPVVRLINWESTQVNSTGVPWVMYWGLYTLQKGAQTKLCYEWQLIANEEQGQGLRVTNGKRGAYHDKDSPTQLLGRRV